MLGCTTATSGNYIYIVLYRRGRVRTSSTRPLSRSPPLVRVDAQRAQEGDPAHLVRVGVRVRVRVRVRVKVRVWVSADGEGEGDAER